MGKRTWQLAKPKPPRKPPVPDDVRERVDAQAAVMVADAKKRFRKPRKSTLINWADDLFTRWHREALYFVVVMRTPHGHPPTFESHAARMEHAGGGKFDVAMPMRKGWNTFKRKASIEERMAEVSRSIYF
jgi:hypothetical protein